MHTRFAIELAAFVLIATQALAVDTTIRVNTPNNTLPAAVQVTLSYPDGTQRTVLSHMAPPAVRTAVDKRNKLMADLNANGVPAATGATPDALVVTGLPPGTQVKFMDLGTAEARDTVAASSAIGGTAQFPGLFDPFDPRNQPAIFTAGIVTDVGTLSVQVSASELNFQTDGPIICQALFQRLAPRAPQYGAQINYAGDRLEVYFDPAYTVTQGGIIFGGTSRTMGVTGQLLMPQAPPRIPGDMNCDGVLNNFDIDPFIEAVTNPSGYSQRYPLCDIMNADINGDGRVDFFDIDPFISHLTG